MSPTHTALRQAALDLPVEDRLELVEALWQSLDPVHKEPPLEDWQRALLDERLAEDEAFPEEGKSWEEIKGRILASR